MENWVLIGIGGALIVTGFLATGISYKAMPPAPKTPEYPMTMRVRVVLFAVGLLALVFGIAGLISK